MVDGFDVKENGAEWKIVLPATCGVTVCIVCALAWKARDIRSYLVCMRTWVGSLARWRHAADIDPLIEARVNQEYDQRRWQVFLVGLWAYAIYLVLTFARHSYGYLVGGRELAPCSATLSLEEVIEFYINNLEVLLWVFTVTLPFNRRWRYLIAVVWIREFLMFVNMVLIPQRFGTTSRFFRDRGLQNMIYFPVVIVGLRKRDLLIISCFVILGFACLRLILFGTGDLLCVESQTGCFALIAEVDRQEGTSWRERSLCSETLGDLVSRLTLGWLCVVGANALVQQILVVTIRHAVEIRSVSGVQSAVWDILDRLCDCVVRIDSDLCAVGPTRKFEGLLHSSYSLEAHSLLRHVASTDQDRFREALVGRRDREDHVNETLHVDFIDTLGVKISTQVFHAAFLDFDGRVNYMLGIKELEEREAGVIAPLRSSTASESDSAGASDSSSSESDSCEDGTVPTATVACAGSLNITASNAAFEVLCFPGCSCVGQNLLTFLANPAGFQMWIAGVVSAMPGMRLPCVRTFGPICTKTSRARPGRTHQRHVPVYIDVLCPNPDVQFAGRPAFRELYSFFVMVRRQRRSRWPNCQSTSPSPMGSSSQSALPLQPGLASGTVEEVLQPSASNTEAFWNAGCTPAHSLPEQPTLVERRVEL